MKKIFTFLALVAVLGLTFYFREDISKFYVENFSTSNRDIKLTYKNDYYRDFNYNYVKITDDFNAKSKTQLINIYYTIINSGIDKFTFYCSKSYDNFINDVVGLANNQTVLSNINSFVHPFNSFSSIETKYDSFGRVTLKINKAYTPDQIKSINNKIKEIITKQVKNTKDEREIIKIIHDYIINNTKYDSDKSDRNIEKYNSNIAYGPLLQGYGLCGGYTDAMAIFLDYYDIPNYKVISENHIWNAVYLNNKWYHLDLTWDDPVMKDGSNTLEYTFFLITTKELEEQATNQHIFNKSVFSEVAK